MHARQVRAGDPERARDRRSRADEDGVDAIAEVLPGEIGADLDARAEARALPSHLLEPTVDVVLLELEVRDAVPQQSADPILALEDDDGVPGSCELLGRGQTCGSGSHDRDGPTGHPLGRARDDEALLERPVDDRLLDVLDRDGGLGDREDARRLAGCGARAAGELREVVRRMEELAGPCRLPAPHGVVELRDDVAQRAPLVAERDPAVHAATGLPHERGVVLPLLLHFAVVEQPDGDGPVRGKLPLRHREESVRVSHESSPGSSPMPRSHRGRCRPPRSAHAARGRPGSQREPVS